MDTHTPQWTDSISNSTLCDYFYIFFVIFSVWAGLSLLAGIWVFSTSKMTIGMLMAVIINIILSFGISATSALFLYLICERALKPALQRTARDGFAAKKSGLGGPVKNEETPGCGWRGAPMWGC
jgi:hypothetical protein